MIEFTVVVESEQVTEEVLALAVGVYWRHFSKSEIVPWSWMCNMLHGMKLADGTWLDMGLDVNSPAMARIREHVEGVRG